jgi:23S rRNA (guanosine2251-2'-O)-methyltransferase
MSERIVYGINSVEQAIFRPAGRLLRVYLQDSLGRQRIARLSKALASRSVPIEHVSAAELEALTGTAKHQGVAALLSSLELMDEGAALEFLAGVENPLILVLDSIEDPRNFGACLRTADGAGVNLVVSGRSRGVDMTPVVSKVASGAAETLPMARVANLARFLKALRDSGVWIVGTDGAADTVVYDANLTGALALVLGGEGKGMRRLTRDHCDVLVRLPMQGSVSSLNVSVAAGVCLYEALRQRRQAAASQ